MLMDEFTENLMKSMKEYDKEFNKDITDFFLKIKEIDDSNIKTDEYGIKYSLQGVPVGVEGKTLVNVIYTLKEALPLSKQDIKAIYATGLEKIKSIYSSLYTEIQKSNLRKTDPELFMNQNQNYEH